LYKIVKENAIVPLLISGLIVAIPSFLLFIIIDSLYYD
jgi:hypothetical protein